MKEFIERAAAINAIRQYQYPYGVEFLLANIPAADVAPVRHGRWIGEPVDIGGSTAMECSECHKVRVVDEYCSACGTLMDGKEDEHDKHSSNPV